MALQGLDLSPSHKPTPAFRLLQGTYRWIART